MRVIVLGGCGAMGTEATRDLAHTSEFEDVVIADADLDRAEALATELGRGRVRAIKIDVSDEDDLAQRLEGFDVVANCTTYHFGLIATRAAIRARVNYLDLGGLFNTPKQLTLNEEAERAGVTICLGCGATPGVTNLITRHAANQMDQVNAVHIAFASFRSIAPSPGLLDTVLDEFSPGSRRFYWEDGQFVEVAAFTGAKVIRFSEPVGELETYYVPHSETHTLPRFLGNGLRRVDVRGSWRPEIMRALRVFADLQLTGDVCISFNGAEANSRQFMRDFILQKTADFGGDGEWAFLLNVAVIGQRNGQPVHIVQNTSHPLRAQWGTQATARMTGIPASIGAQKLARGEAKRKGVIAPEACFEPASFFAELSKRGISIDVQTVQD